MADLRIKVVTAPAELPVSIADVKEHLRIEIADDDRDIERKIKAAVAQLDPPYGWLGRAMITQTLEESLESFPSRSIILPYPPTQAVDSVKYYDTDNVLQPVSSSIYVFKNDSEPAQIILKDGESWPTDLSYDDDYPVRITFQAGYGDKPGDVPEDLRLWIMMTIGDYYLLRENLMVGQTIQHNEFTRRIVDNHIWRHVG